MVACSFVVDDGCCDNAVHTISYSNGEKLPLKHLHWRSSKDKQNLTTNLSYEHVILNM